ncbi:MAG: class I SAM-dependent methyltransferase [Actinomycetota bacterium]
MSNGAVRRVLAESPWPVKILGKLLLSRLPVPYRSWSTLALFKHGAMEDPAYALDVVRGHVEAAAPPEGFVALELGPGDTAASALVAYALGARATHLVDAGPYARRDLAPYLRVAAFLRRLGLRTPELERARSLEDVLERCGATYSTEGIRSLRELPDASIDVSWSHAVLEHVRRDELPGTLRELRRLARPGGASSHEIDLEDHLAHALNSLRFPARMWESRLFASSGFYTNRLRASDLVRIFGQTGWEIQALRESRWAKLPTPRSRLAPEFRCLLDADLRVKQMRVLLRPH